MESLDSFGDARQLPWLRFYVVNFYLQIKFDVSTSALDVASNCRKILWSSPPRHTLALEKGTAIHQYGEYYILGTYSISIDDMSRTNFFIDFLPEPDNDCKGSHSEYDKLKLCSTCKATISFTFTHCEKYQSCGKYCKCRYSQSRARCPHMYTQRKFDQVFKVQGIVEWDRRMYSQCLTLYDHLSTLLECYNRKYWLESFGDFLGQSNTQKNKIHGTSMMKKN
jgi:hypothetical protein